MEKDIGKINKSDTTDIVVRVDDFGGKPGLTIREFVTSERYTGFTKQGVRIPAHEFKRFKEMINSITEKDLEAPKESESSSHENSHDKKQKKIPSEDTEDQNFDDY